MEARLLTFLGVAVVITVTPGPDFALVTRVAIARGRAAAWRTSLGVVTGHLLWGVASGIGVAAMLAASATLYAVLRLAGAVYLVWLGLHALFWHRPDADMSIAPTHRIRAGAYPQGLINDLLNPKIGVFYTTLLPQFIAPGQPVLLTSVALTAIMACVVAVWLGFYLAVLDRAGDVLRRPRVRRVMERFTGVVLVGLGVRVVMERR
jgi:threonine/homoserine/homoserine lactone efflux protein